MNLNLQGAFEVAALLLILKIISYSLLGQPTVPIGLRELSDRITKHIWSGILVRLGQDQYLFFRVVL